MNTMKAYRELLEAGFEEKQGQVVISVIEESVQNQSATKLDLAKTEKRLDNKIDNLEKKLENKISEVKSELLETEKKLENKISETEKKLDNKIDNLEKKLDNKITKLEIDLLKSEKRLIIWFITSLITVTGVIIAVLK